MPTTIPRHPTDHVATTPDGLREFACPVCGYRVLVAPGSLVVLDVGDLMTRHEGAVEVFDGTEARRLEPFREWWEGRHHG